MSNEDEATRRKNLANKFPEMEQHFEELKKEIYEPQVERLGETKKEQNQRTRGQ